MLGQANNQENQESKTPNQIINQSNYKYIS